ncbi:MAG: DUF499 domain-containing protein [Candidatus Aminicenantes bacterium]|nr:DUF499 domain-containing protein [Candidatus Aminicenantes bacterium]NIM81655.1 DUF499 domain-containing protein [Candidatus Aminicenantes bacterium]NIN21025.1 DUF499 domain-containing protein [Candidatus Aminicenantes bacterium]NIN44846.1 DUF499 domain-containing protein [Candidatus Aminicenantes bacterium]NIN87654.1 DUF499 domain-containing protein [Candidatus Aminicenantes bacterium]
MNSFHTIAVPHKDILEKRFTLDTFAADLWDVFHQRGVDEYKDSIIFFEKTYLTEGLRNLLDIVERRVKGKGGDPVIQLQTPFGGGKTHALIAMYHKAPQWDVKPVVIVGTSLNPNKETLWGMLEQQLTGRISQLSGQVSPGKEAIRDLLNRHQPTMILMDEILQYTTRAAGIKVEDTTLAAQTIAFMQELTELSATLEKVALIITLPSSITEHYDESAELLYKKLQKVSGRVEKIYTPVQDFEISKIVRRRLFSHMDETQAQKVVNEFTTYAQKEGILPENTQPSEYRQRFMDSYPFLPEVIDVLYHRWGSYPEFQRTRGVLRLLALVIFSSMKSQIPYISLADFDLNHQELRQELLKHIGQEFNSIIDMDISGTTANAKKVDQLLGDAYRGLHLGSRTAAGIFIYSFSGGREQGVNLLDIKRIATTTQNPAAIISETLTQMENKLFYLQNIGAKYFFSIQANLNRILMNQKANVKEEQIQEFERELLQKNSCSGYFKVYIWETDPQKIPDTQDFKLLILETSSPSVMEDIRNKKGQTPRVYRNTIIFLNPVENERMAFHDTIRQQIAYRAIEKDPHLSLTKEQADTVKSQLKKISTNLNDGILRSYRVIMLPDREGFKRIDLGVPTYGISPLLDDEVYKRLRIENEILENINPIALKEKFLSKNEYVLTEQLYYSSLKTPGETRFRSRDALEKAVKEGVRKGMFGLGEMENNRPRYRYFKEEIESPISFEGNECIIRDFICIAQKQAEQRPEPEPQPGVIKQPEPVYGPEPPPEPEPVLTKDRLRLKFELPKGKVSNMMGVCNYLQSKFQRLKIELIAEDGGITDREYEDKILEAFNQSGIDLEE